MSISEDPDESTPQAVSILLERLINQARDAVSGDASDARNPLFSFIQKQLENMKEPLQKFKTSFLEELRELGKDLDLKDLDMEGQVDKLGDIQRKIGYLLHLLSKAEHKHAKDRLFFPKSKMEGPSNQTENKNHMSVEMMSNFSSMFQSLERDNVKLCLMYLSIFPENVLIEKRPIIYSWMRERLIKDKEEGEQVFNQFLELEFIKSDTESQGATVNSFTVHPFPRQMLPDDDSRWAEARSKALLLFFSPESNNEITDEGTSYQSDDKILNNEERLSKFSSMERNQIKKCLLHLSIFPENVLIKKRPIIYWWMGEGLIEDKEEGEQVFNRLLELRFIKAEAKSQWPIVNSFTVHPFVRLLVTRDDLQKEIKPLLLLENEKTTDGANGNTIDGANGNTIFNLNNRILQAKPNWGHGKLKVVQLGRWQSNPKHHIEVENRETLNGLGSSKDLKYLSLRGISRIEALPKWILRLQNLEILDLRACHNLEKLPDGKWELNNLIHLDVSECYLLESIPEGIQHLHKLQVLKGFVIGKARKNSCKLTDLQKLSSLRKLSIRVVGEDYSDLDLSNLSSLQILTISWSLVSSTKVPSLKNLPQLKKLELHCWPVTELLEIAGLEKLYILGGKIMKLERNPTIKYLRLKHLEDLSMGGEELESLFPEYLFIQKIGCGGRYPNETLEKPGLMKSIAV